MLKDFDIYNQMHMNYLNMFEEKLHAKESLL